MGLAGTWKMLKRFAWVATTALLAVGPVGATLLEGKTIGFQVNLPTRGTYFEDSANGHYLVGPGPEVLGYRTTGDFSDTNYRAVFQRSGQYNSHADFVGWAIFDFDNSIDAFTSAELDSETNMAGLDASRLSFDVNHVWINLKGLFFEPGTIISINVGSDPVGSVPEPGTLALLGFSLVGLVAARRRRQ